MYSLNPKSGLPKGPRSCSYTSTAITTAFRHSQRSWYSKTEGDKTHQRTAPLQFPSSAQTTFNKRVALVGGFGLAALLSALLVAHADEKKKTDQEENKKKKRPIEHEMMPLDLATLTFAPEVPPPITRDFPVLLQVFMDTSIEVLPVDPFYKYEFWTFNGRMPGPFIRARVGDLMEVCFTNKDASGMQHNVDFHAACAPGGCAGALSANQGETKSAVVKLMYPGLYIYHCAVDPISMHIANGMYGLILVEPEGGLPKVDKEFYVLQGEIYAAADPPSKDTDILPFCWEDGLQENPKYVVFNGRVGSLMEEGALEAKTGEKIRIYFGNIGPNLISSFHVVGAIFDKVYREGDLISPPARGIQTTLVPAGGAVVVDLEINVPGTYTLLDHSIFRTEKGAAGFLHVEGKDRTDLFHPYDKQNACISCRFHPPPKNQQ